MLTSLFECKVFELSQFNPCQKTDSKEGKKSNSENKDGKYDHHEETSMKNVAVETNKRPAVDTKDMLLGE